EWGKVKTLPCPACAAVDDSQPFNVVIVGSDSRVGDSAAETKSFGSVSQVGGQRSDTIKILHVNPAAGTAQLLSIPRDTYVQLTGLPASAGLATDNKINSAFNNGPNPLVETLQDTFGIPIQHFVVIDFNDEVNLVNSVAGINLNFPYPVRDYDEQTGTNNSGLDITNTGCQTLNGTEALALSRSRYYQYYEDGYWQQDPSSDIGRIERQNIIIESVIDKAKSLYNPLKLNSFLSTVVRDVEIDQQMSFGTMFSLAERYHAFSGSKLTTYTLPTVSEQTSGGSDVQVVEEPQAQQMISQFLGTQPQTVTTPPIDQYGNAIPVPTSTGSSGSSTGSSGSGSSGSSGSSSSSGAAGSSSSSSGGVTANSVPPFDPTPC
ncbi:MAG: LCP family protein, partial [Acidimicrobiales bacterium]